MNLIEQRVVLARKNANPYVICRLRSGWVVIGDVQPLPGYCLLLADPVVGSLNDLDEEGRIQYLLDVTRVGDAILASTAAFRINYEIWGNDEPALHTHIMPRYGNEPDEKRLRPACMGYDWSKSRRFDPSCDCSFMEKIRNILEADIVNNKK